MVQVIDPGPSMGENIGAGAGQGISAGLQMLLQEKMSKMQQQKKAAALETAGLPGGLAALDPAILKEFAKSKAQEQAIQGLFGDSPDYTQSKAALQAPQQQGLDTQSKAALQPSGEQQAQTTPGVPQGAARLKEMSDAQLQILQGFPAYKDIAKSELDMRQRKEDVGEKREAAKIKRESERSLPILKRADERAESLARKESSLATMKHAIETGSVGPFSGANLAELTGLEGFRSGGGAAFLAASKEFFMGSLKLAGPKPNQMLETQILKMLPQIGRTEVGNLAGTAILENDIAVERKELELISKFSESDEEKYGYVRGNIGQRVSKELKKFAEEEQDRLLEKLNVLEATHSKEKSTSQGILMIAPDGEQYRVEKKDIKEAKEAGYKLK